MEILGSISTLESSLFSGCTKLASITIPDTVESISEKAFYGCSTLGSITIPESTNKIGNSAFEGCTGLTKLTLPISFNSIGTDNTPIFSSCTNINEVTFTAGTGTWYDYGSSYKSTPWQCASADLTIILSEGITSIVDNVFCGCTALTTVEIGKSVTTIEESAFEGCTSLSTLIVNKENSEYMSINGVLFNQNGTKLIMYPVGKTDKSYEVPNDVEIIGAHAFKNCTNIETVILGDNVNSIENDAFIGCTSFESFEVNDGNTKYSTDHGVLCSYDGYTLIKFPTGKQTTPYKTPDAVTSIESYAFAYCIYLDSVTISDKVISIGNHAFYNCPKLNSVTIDTLVQTIGDFAFYNCSNLQEVNICSSVLKTIGESAFYNCSNLHAITIPDTIEKVGDSAFEGCTGLTELTIPINLNCVGSNDHPIFKGCVDIEKITFTTGSGTWYPYGSDEAQESCYKYTPWQITEADLVIDLSKTTVTTIPSLIFYNCDTLCSVTLNDLITSIGDCAFRGCVSLDSITLPTTLNSIGIYAFEGCTGLKSLLIPEKVESIGERAFEGCTGIGSVTIPGKVKSIGVRAFNDCTNLISITVNENNADYSSYDGVLFNKDKTTLIQYPAGKTSGSYEVPGTVTSIGVSAFYNNKLLTAITIPDRITSIGVSAFYGCTGLKELTIPAGLDSVVLNEHPAFEGCVNIEKIVFTGSGEWFVYGDSDSQSSYYGYTPWQFSRSALKTVDISNGVTTVDKFAFAGCSALESVILPNSVESIGISTFKDCVGLKKLSVPTSLNTVVFNETCAFEGCVNVAEITFTKGKGTWFDYDRDAEHQKYYFGFTPWNLTKVELTAIISDDIEFIDWHAFEDCETIVNLTIGNSVKSIENYAFSGCRALRSVDIPDSVTSIGGAAFQGCYALTHVSLSNNMTTIASTTFLSCKALSDVDFGRSVKSIGYMAFQDCAITSLNLENIEYIGESAFSGNTDLIEVKLGNSLETIGVGAFWHCYDLKEVDFGTSVKTIGNNAFSSCWNLQSVNLPSSVETIGYAAFSYCWQLKEAILGDSVTTLGGGAFYECHRLTHVTIPISVNAVGSGEYDAFGLASAIENITFTKGSGTWYKYDATSNVPWRTTSASVTITLSEGITSVPDEMFNGCTKINYLNISSSVTTLGEKSFYMCTGLRTVTIPSTLTSIGSFAFSGCTALGSIDVENENRIYSSADGVLFSKNQSVLIQYPTGRSATSYTVPNTVVSIGEGAFKDCKNLNSVIISDSVTSAGYYAFENCINLNEITVPLSLDCVGYNDRPIFDNCVIIDKITFTKGSGTWYKYGASSSEASYYGNTPWQRTIKSLTITLADGVTSVDDQVLYKNTHIITVNIGHSLETIEPFAFEGCTKLTTFSVSEDNPNFSSDENGVLFNKNKTTLVLYPLGKTEDTYTIPDSVESIEKYAFYECTALTSIVIPNSVRTLGESAFYGCINLIALSIPVSLDSVSSNEHPAFEGCIGIIGVIFTGTENWYPYGPSKSDASYYKNTPWQLSGSVLESIIISDEVKSIGDHAFEGCSKLNSVTFRSSPTYLGSSAFRACTSLETVVLPDSLTSIGESAFFECTGLKSVTLPTSLIWIGDDAFYGCNNLESVIFNGKNKENTDFNLESIGDNAFGYCSSLKSIAIPDSVTFIGSRAFYLCTALKSVTIGNSVENIGAFAFYECTSLTSLTIPDSVITIGTSTFGGCTALTELSIPASLDSVASNSDPAFKDCININKITFTGTGTWYQYGSTKSEPSYYGYTPWQLTKADLTVVIAEGVPSIGKLAFNNSSLISVTIPSSVTVIEDKAFGDCAKLTNFTVSKDNTQYFSDNDGVLFKNETDGKILVQFPAGKEDTSYSIPNGVTTIGPSAFYGCSNLTELTLGSSITSIEKESFAHCYLTSINVAEDNQSYVSDDGVLFNKNKTTLILYPANKTSDGYYTIPDSVVTIGDYAFNGCTNLTHITLGESLESIGYMAFEGCTNLVAFMSSVTNQHYSTQDGVLFDKQKTLVLYPKGKDVTTYEIPNDTKIIGDYAFYECTELTNITIPISVTAIGKCAFYGCAKLTSITISNPDTELGDSAFKDCKLLQELRIPVSANSVGSNAYPAFEGCTNITKITFTGAGDWFTYSMDETQGPYYEYTPWYLSRTVLKTVVLADDVTSVGKNIFYNCTYLKTVEIGKSVSSIDRSAFDGCTRLTAFNVAVENPTYQSENGVLLNWEKDTLVLYPRGLNKTTYELPGSVTKIGDYAFYRCSDLTSMDLSSIKSIGKYAFFGCTKLTELTLSDSLESIGDYAFYNCTPLKSVDLGKSIESIGKYAFYGCTKLTTLTIPDSITSIGESSFSGCIGLTELTIPTHLDCVVSTEHPAFEGCVNISKFTFTAGDGTWPEQAYKYTPWQNTAGEFTVVLSEGVKSVGNHAFYGCAKLTSVDLGTTLGSIGDYAFFDCTAITSLNIPDGVTTIGNNALCGCTAIGSLTLPNSLESIGSSAFQNCISLETVVFGNKLETIGDDAFYNCILLSSIELPDSVTSIGKGIFAYCSALSEVKLSNKVGSIGDNAFYNCIMLSSIELPDTVGSIGAAAFRGCKTLSSTNIPHQVSSIGYYAFYDCVSISKIELPDSLGSIGHYAFYGCIGLNELSIPAHVNSVGSNDQPAFEGCVNINKIAFTGSKDWYDYSTSASEGSYYGLTPWQLSRSALTTVIITDEVTSIGSYAFYGCTVLTELTIPANLDSVVSNEHPAFEDCTNINKITFTGSKDWFKYGTSKSEGSYYAYTPWQLSSSVLKDVTISEGVTSIGDLAFRNCMLIESLIIPDSVTTLGNSTFSGCIGLKELTLPTSLDTVVSNDHPAFEGCVNIDKITFTAGNGKWYSYGADESQKSYYKYAPWQITNAKVTIDISEDVTSIGEKALYDCANIINVDLGASVGSIGDLAFFNCTHLTGFTVGDENTNYSSNDGVLFKDKRSILVLYPLGKTGSTYDIPGSVTTIGNYAFANSTFTSMTIPDTVEKIGEGAFEGCTGLKELSIPVSLDTVGSNTSPIFSGCTNIQKITFTAGSGSWYDYGLSELDSSYYGYTPWQLNGSILNNVTISNGVKSIGDNAFEGCTKLDTISFPDSVTTVGKSAFNGCTALVEIALGTEIASVGDSAFEGCTSLASVTISGSVTKLGSSVFKDCAKLEKLIILISIDTVVSNDHPAFEGCVNIKMITFTAGTGSWYSYGADESQASCYKHTPWQITKATLTVAISDDISSIGTSVFKDCSKLTNVSLGESITSIGDHAFNNCAYLSSVTIPSKVTSIGASAFEGCVSLGSIVIPSKVTSIGDHAFFNCTKLAELTVSVDNTAYSSKDNVLFKDNGSVLVLYPIGRSSNSYTIPDSVTSIAASAFAYCTSLISVEIPDSVESIGKSAFYGCTGLTELTIPANIDSVVSNDHPAFEGCVKINKITFTGSKEWFEYSTSASEGSYYAYTPWQLSSSVLKEVTISEGVTSVGDLAFRNCVLIESLIIPDSVTSVGNWAFKNCTGLKTLSIPVNLDCAGSNDRPIFSGCTNIENITFTGSGDWYSYESSYTYTPWYLSRANLITVTISDGVKSIGYHAFDGCGKLTSVTIPDSVTTIGDAAFSNCTALRSVDMGDSVTKLGDEVFKGCTSLPSLNLGSVSSMGEGVLYNCTSLKSVSLGSSIQYIGDYTFYNCTALGSINIPNSVKTIGAFAFTNCTALGSIAIPSSATKIGNSAFANCTALTAMNIPDTIGTIGEGAFKDCTGLKELLIPVSLDSVGSSTSPIFSGCTNIQKITFTAGTGDWYDYERSYSEYTPWQLSKAVLKDIAISDGVKSIGDYAFYNDTALVSVSLPDSVTKIGACTFCGCTSLASIDLGDSIESIGFSAFYNCASLSSLSLCSSVKSIGISAFEGCTSLASLVIPDSVAELKDSAFKDCTGLKELTVSISLDTVVSNENPAFEGCVNIEKITFTTGSGNWYSYGADEFQYTPWKLTKAALNATISDGITSIVDCAFDHCTLSSVYIPSTVTSIGISAFEGCTSLASLVIPDSVTELGTSAFKDCTGLKELTVPASLNCVGSNQSPFFSGCVNIEKVSFTAGTGTWYPYDSPSVVDNGHTNNVSTGELPYYGLTPWQLSGSVLNTVFISEGVRSVGNSAFKDCTGLTSVTLPSTVTTIGNSAFRGCTSITSFDINEYNEEYSQVDGVLFDKSMTTLIEYPAGNTNRSYAISDKVTTIGNYAFYDCTYLTSITIPSSITSIGDSAFKGVFYDTDGETVLEPTAANLAGSTFEKTGDKWVKQVPSPTDEKSGGNAMIFILIAVIAAIIVSAAVVIVKKRKA